MSSSRPYQYPLDLKFHPAFDAGDFFVSDSNRHAVEALSNWQSWRENTLIITGPTGCGKTHLLKVWQHLSHAAFANYHHLKKHQDLLTFLAPLPGLAFDDIEVIDDECFLFHLFNSMKELRKPLLLTATLLPSQWPFQLPDLTSRLKAAPLINIAPPDDALLAAVLMKQLHDQHLTPPLEVIEYLLKRIERSFAAVRTIVDSLHHLSLSKQQRLTIPLAKEALATGEERIPSSSRHSA